VQQQFYTQGIFIALLPQCNLQSEIVAISIKLVNQTSFSVKYECSFNIGSRPEKYLKNTLQKGEIVQVEGFMFSEYNGNPTLDIWVKVGQSEVEKHFKFKAKTVFNKPPFVQLLNAEAFLFDVWKENNFLDEDDEDDNFEDADDNEDEAPKESLAIDTTLLKEMMLGGNKPLRSKIIHETASDKIDLHIEAINPDFENLPAAEILTIQMNLFMQTLERAIASGHHSLIAIHGVGDGVLRKKIIYYSNHHPRVKECTEPLVNKYGTGATEIHFK
jgi:hypothetical protein